jgi:hypothetical protein
MGTGARMVAFSDRVVTPSYVRISQLGGESALLNTETEIYFGLDAMGTRIWELATTERSIEAVFKKLAEEFDVEPELLRHDVTELLDRLLEHGLLKIAPNDVASFPEI